MCLEHTAQSQTRHTSSRLVWLSGVNHTVVAPQEERSAGSDPRVLEMRSQHPLNTYSSPAATRYSHFPSSHRVATVPLLPLFRVCLRFFFLLLATMVIDLDAAMPCPTQPSPVPIADTPAVQLVAAEQVASAVSSWSDDPALPSVLPDSKRLCPVSLQRETHTTDVLPFEPMPH